MNDSRTTAAVFPSFASAAPVRKSVVRCSAPVKSVAIGPPSFETVARPESPATSSPNRIVSGEIQRRVEADAFIPGVTFLGFPPARGRTQTSPPVEPWSLMMPPMNATEEPSGEKRGSAIWSSGGGL